MEVGIGAVLTLEVHVTPAGDVDIALTVESEHGVRLSTTGIDSSDGLRETLANDAFCLGLAEANEGLDGLLLLVNNVPFPSVDEGIKKLADGLVVGFGDPALRWQLPLTLILGWLLGAALPDAVFHVVSLLGVEERLQHPQYIIIHID